MPTALDRLLANPSALRALRGIITSPELPSTWIQSHNYCRRTAFRCRKSSTATTLLAGKEENSQDTLGLSPRSLRTILSRSRPLRPTYLTLHLNPSQSRENLDLQSSVDQPPDSLALKIDDLKYRLDYNVWVELLQYRERTYGLHGIYNIWKGMRNRAVDLPTTERNADILWGTFITHQKIVKEVLAYAVDLHRKTGQVYEPLYERCIGHWLARNPQLAYECHSILSKLHGPKTRSLHTFAQAAARHTASLAIFRKIYLDSGERDVYDSLMSELFSKGKLEAARTWHSFLFDHNDFPSALASHPMVVQFSKEDQMSYQARVSTHKTRKGDTIIKRYSFIDVEGRRRGEDPKISREIMSRLLGEAHDIKPKQFEDSFCARLFATKAFTPGAVIKGLGMLGIEKIGPLALREIGLRTEPLDEMPQKFKELKEAGISIGHSVFSKSVEKFTAEGRFAMVRDLLESDQHPDVFEDRDLQQELLVYFISRNAWRQVHRTLAILTIYHNDPANESWNLLLRTHAEHFCDEHFGAGRLVKIVDDMCVNRIPINGKTITFIHKYILRVRNKSKRPITWGPNSEFDDLRFVTRLFFKIMESGNELPPWRWHEIIRRFGMTGRLRELRRLVHWLLAWYSPRTALATGSQFAPTAARPPSISTFNQTYLQKPIQSFPTKLSPQHSEHPLRKLFPPSLQAALIEWGFKTGLAPNAPYEKSMLQRIKINMSRGQRNPLLDRAHPVHWSYGLRLVAFLRDVGVVVQVGTVRKAIQRRLVILYGSGKSKRKSNRVASKANVLKFEDVMLEAEKVVGKRLFHWPGREDGQGSPLEKGSVQGDAAVGKKSVAMAKDDAKTQAAQITVLLNKSRLQESTKAIPLVERSAELAT
ncbi:hypothetical protein K432DRAFT_377483 [Lepidopterella palustris CBS 459.81]|uniref:Pentatricopeptide repeat domain-containing protein n=1 Tax=Lepidopterella palustris CBS 459.81 TaxID=1314670 RepID=A0A8E2EKM2_9PEZI|nr:hypothetical protein K432DRAFT_377483 [Lepidopterella palustris CBS 459.81]